MKLLLVLLFATQLYAAPSLTQEWVSEESLPATQASHAFESILNTQGAALERASAKENLPLGFELKGLVTDIGVTKSGVLGFSALKSGHGIQLKWKKQIHPNPSPLIAEELTQEAEVILDENEGEIDLQQTSEMIAEIARASGKVRNTRRLERNLHHSLSRVQETLKQIQLTRLSNWKADTLRLDLNFSAGGKVWFVAKAGASLRIRMEWKLKDRSQLSNKSALTQETQFVGRTLVALEEAFTRTPIPGFEPKKVNIGVGLTHKGSILGLWKGSAGFMGFLAFVPTTKKPVPMNKSALPADFLKNEFTLDGKAGVRLASGIQKSLGIAAYFADRAAAPRAYSWYVSDLRAIFDISKSGFFGLSTVSSKGVVEIDFKRKK